MTFRKHIKNLISKDLESISKQPIKSFSFSPKVEEKKSGDKINVKVEIDVDTAQLTLYDFIFGDKINIKESDFFYVERETIFDWWPKSDFWSTRDKDFVNWQILDNVICQRAESLFSDIVKNEIPNSSLNFHTLYYDRKNLFIRDFSYQQTNISKRVAQLFAEDWPYPISHQKIFNSYSAHNYYANKSADSVESRRSLLHMIYDFSDWLFPLPIERLKDILTKWGCVEFGRLKSYDDDLGFHHRVGTFENWTRAILPGSLEKCEVEISALMIEAQTAREKLKDLSKTLHFGDKMSIFAEASIIYEPSTLREWKLNKLLNDTKQKDLLSTEKVLFVKHENNQL